MTVRAPAPPHTLSKSDFKVARTCPTKLYYREMKYPNNQLDDEYLQLLAEGGYMVEAIAKLAYPDGVDLEGDPDQAETARRTAEMLQLEEVTLFGAIILDGLRLVEIDILQKCGTTLKLFEVKAGQYDPEDGDKRIAKTGSPFRALTKPKGAPSYEIASVWSVYLEDVTYQTDVLRAAFPWAEVRPHLVLVNKAHRTVIDGLPRWFTVDRSVGADGHSHLHRVRFTGEGDAIRREAFLTTIPVPKEVEELLPEVQEASRLFLASLEAGPSRITPPLSRHCRDCDYRTTSEVKPRGWAECWGDRANVVPHILELYRAPELIDELISAGVSSLLDIPEARLITKAGTVGETNVRQLVQIQHTRARTEWIGPLLKPALQGLCYPLHFIDFEAARAAIPHYAGMRPYGLIAFQWSCHTLREPGGVFEHSEWINVEDLWPNQEFARTLRDAIGTEGSILTWSQFEKSVLLDIAAELTPMGKVDAELAEWLVLACSPDRPSPRLLDLYKLCLQSYFHPGMGREASIKVVLDALWRASPEMRGRFSEMAGREGDPELGPYAALPPMLINGKERYVQEGTGAIRAYEAMMYGVERDDAESKGAWRELLLQYCKLDTLAMVLIWEYWMRTAGVS